MASSIAVAGSKFFDRLNAFRERYGTTAALYKSFDVVLHKVFRTSVYTVVWLDLDSLAEMAPPDPQFTFRFLTAEEVETFAKDPSYYLSPTLADGIRNGCEVCFAAFAGDRLAAFGCYTLGYVQPEKAAGAAISFPSDVAYMSFGFTHADFRGGAAPRPHHEHGAQGTRESAASQRSFHSSPVRIGPRSKAVGAWVISASAT